MEVDCGRVDLYA